MECGIDELVLTNLFQNQFFISSLKELQNGIAEMLRQRIARAYQEKQLFRVIIVMPLLPSFSGMALIRDNKDYSERLVPFFYHLVTADDRLD